MPVELACVLRRRNDLRWGDGTVGDDVADASAFADVFAGLGERFSDSNVRSLGSVRFERARDALREHDVLEGNVPFEEQLTLPLHPRLDLFLGHAGQDAFDRLALHATSSLDGVRSHELKAPDLRLARRV